MTDRYSLLQHKTALKECFAQCQCGGLHKLSESRKALWQMEMKRSTFQCFPRTRATCTQKALTVQEAGALRTTQAFKEQEADIPCRFCRIAFCMAA